jgi:hypothetical protein
MEQAINETKVSSSDTKDRVAVDSSHNKESAIPRVKRDNLYTLSVKLISPYLPAIPETQTPAVLVPICNAIDNFFGCTKLGYLLS